MSRWKFVVGLVVLYAPLGLPAENKDVPGGVDYAPVGRYEGSVITGYQSAEFDQYTYYTGPVKRRGDNSQGEKLEGRLQHVAYQVPQGASQADVFGNFRNKLEGQGFTTVFSCSNKECGGTEFAYAVKTLPIPQMVVDPFNYRYLAAQKVSSGTRVSLALLVSEDTHKRVRAHLTVVEAGELENKMVDAKQMAAGLGEAGHIALYGIYFDTDKAVIKPESRPTLEEIAKLLGTDPALKIILVGHTDNQGAYDYNMDLSKRRAQAVLERLTGEFGVAAGRLRAAGVGYLAPVASNAAESGRALNRRVELVEDK